MRAANSGVRRSLIMHGFDQRTRENAACRSHTFEKMLDELYAGVSDPKALETALGLAKDQLGAHGVNIHAISKKTLETLFFLGFGDGYTDESIAAYLDHWQYVNAHRDAMRKAYSPEGTNVFLCHEHFTEEHWKNGAYFQDFFSKIGSRWLAGAVVWQDDETEVSIAFSRNENARPFGEDARAFLLAFIPHLRRAVRLALNVGAAHGPRGAPVNLALSSARTPSFLIDGKGKVLWRNSSAEELLNDVKTLRIEDSRLILDDAAETEALSRAISAAGSRRLAETPPAYLKADAGGEPLEIEILPATVPSGALIGARALVLVMVRTIGPTSQAVDQLKTIYGLTDAECNIAISLAKGATVQTTADEAGVSQHTIRTQLRSIFSKTGINRQSALAALVWKSS